MSVVETEESLQGSQSLTGMLPGPALADALAETALGGLDEYALVEAMRAARRLTAWAESVELAAVAELDRRRELEADRYGSWTVEMSQAECDEISAALTLSGTAAAIRLGIAIALHKTLPGTRQALAEGRIDGSKARVICDATTGVSTELARKVERLVLPEAPRLTARQLAVRLRKAIVEADPQAFEEHRKTVEKGRRLEQYTNPDGTTDLAARDLPTDAADAAYNYVNALAAALKADGDERPIDALRADVTLDLLRGRRPAELSATVAGLPDPAPGLSDPPPGLSDRAPGQADRAPGQADPVTGLSDPALGQAVAQARPCGSARTGQRPASDVGDNGRQEATAIAGTVRAQLVELHDQVRGLDRSGERRLLVAEAARRVKDALAPLKSRWCHIAADTIGDLEHGHDGYRPPEAMRRLIQARNGTCTFPTCRRNVMKCDLDHTIPYGKGGPTCPCNIAPLCRGHHLLKQHPDWTLVQLWPGVLLWTSPTGHWYLVGPDP